jgi:hypothetical protein
MKLSQLKNFTSLVVFFSFDTLFSQTYTYDEFRKDSLEIIKTRLVRPQFKLDNRVALYNSQALDINGFDIGVLLSNKLRVTLGYYGMSGSLKSFNKTKEGIDYTRLIEMDYGSLNTELIYRDWRFFSLGMPFEIAAGINKLSDKNITDNEIVATQTAPLLFFNFGVSGTFKPMRFLGLKGMLGYRKVGYNGAKDFDFNGFFTSIGLNMDLRELISDVKMYRLKKRYKRGNNLSNAVNILTD